MIIRTSISQRVQPSLSTKRILFLVLIFLALGICGCAEKDTKTLDFKDVSAGIPTSLQFRENVCFYDLNGDGLDDLITPAPRPYLTTPRVFLNKGDYWSEITQDCNFPSVVNFYGWVESDSSGNLFFGIHGRGIYALKRVGFCSWINASDGLPSTGEFTSRAIAIGDINNDGLVDMAALSDSFYASPSIRVFMGNGLFQWREISDGLPSNVGGDHISISDINKDGYGDLLVDNNNQSSNSIVWFGNGAGNWMSGSYNLPQGLYFATTPIRSGFLSMLYSDKIEGGPFLFLFDSGKWLLQEETGLPNSWYISAIAVADINGDGLEDIVLGNNLTMSLDIFLGIGTYKFSKITSLPLPVNHGYIWNIRVRDINRDGKPDIIVNMASADNEGTIRIFIQR